MLEVQHFLHLFTLCSNENEIQSNFNSTYNSFWIVFFNYFLESKNIFYVSLILSGLGVLSIRLSEIIEKLWFKLSYLLSQTIPNILLSVIFFLILTPIALLSRLFKSQTEFISKNNQNSMFRIKNKSFNKESFKRAW